MMYLALTTVFRSDTRWKIPLPVRMRMKGAAVLFSLLKPLQCPFDCQTVYNEDSVRTKLESFSFENLAFKIPYITKTGSNVLVILSSEGRGFLLWGSLSKWDYSGWWRVTIWNCVFFEIYVLFHFFHYRAFDQLGCKEQIMLRMSHEDQQVKYEALVAVQKLLVHNWYDLMLGTWKANVL